MIYIKTLTLTFLLLFLNACGESTTTPITTDVSGMTIDVPDKTIGDGFTISIYSTELFSPSATVTYFDGGDDNATDSINWKVSDNTLIYLSNDLTVLPLANEGNTTLTAGYKEYKYFENNVTLDIIGIIDINATDDADKTWWISSADVNTSGEYILTADGNFTDGESWTIVRNIAWYSSNTAIATITFDENYVTTLNVISTGDVNITATLFGDDNASISKEYTIN